MNESREIHVVIADDHPVVRLGIRMMLEMGEGIQLVGEAVDGESVLQLVEERQPDVVLMDLRMPKMDGLEALKRLHTAWPRVAVIMLTTYNEDDLMISSLRAGARGYLLKDADLSVVLHTIHAAARGEMLMQPEMMERILTRAERTLSPPVASKSHRLSLTARERDILAAVARGERSKEIAVRFVVTERTVNAHLASIYAKLGVDSRAAAVAVALEQGLLSFEE
ncbi:response regulator transcription factor [Ktedonobacter robiniae]|uniref:DNA-binding response regulator n=1 Tax=Ktedonobacter robiniae TaxID=2778365 RepID=A0ABQ3UP54_9CHLR|nr:response regulator transcription factor [Ktedonobacter robiniae]GHO54465.1 DNA-binding response regulator [Ktedonobacter robiniae]